VVDIVVGNKNNPNARRDDDSIEPMAISRRDVLLPFPVRGLMVGALSVRSAGAPTLPEEVYDRILEFEKYWDKFLRGLFGCSGVGEMSLENCKPQMGKVDYGLWNKSRKAAMKLFELGEK